MKAPAKTSKALAKLAADYLNLTLEELVDRATDTLMQEKLLKDIHKLAGSVLRQVEGSEVAK